MKSKFLIVAAAASSAALVLTACGSDSSKSGGSSTSSSGAGTTTSASSSAPAASTATVASKLVIGGPAQFKTRADGIAGLKSKYGVEFKSFTVTDIGGPVTVSALKTGRVDVADLFSTDPAIKANGFVILKDDKNNFGAQNILPIVTKSKATPGVKSTLNAVSGKLTTAAVQGLRTSVETNKQDPDKVAKAWLKTNSLDATGSAASGVKMTVGSAGFPENAVLADIYGEALKAQGASISFKLNIGERTKYFPALKTGQIDLIPEYTGSILFYLNTKNTAVSTPAVYAALVKALPTNLVALAQSTAQDSDAIVVTKATAAKYSLATISDLAKTS